MKKEPNELNKVSVKIDVKDFLVKGAVGDVQEVAIAKGLTLGMNEENVLKNYKGEVKLTLLGDEILAEFNINYTAETICARCLKKFDRHGESKFDREYKIGKRVAEPDELIVDKNFQIEVGEPMIEEITFDIPMKPLCDKKCRGITQKKQDTSNNNQTNS